MAWGSNGGGIGAFSVNTADPKFTIKFYLVRLVEQKKSEIESKEKVTILYQAPAKEIPKEKQAKKTIFGVEVND
jgi:hypothetical protein